MKKASIFFAAAMFLGLSSVMAAPKTETPAKNPFVKQIEFLLNQNDISPDEGELKAKVLFTFDAENRIQILEVESGHEDFAEFISTHLDGQRVYVDESLAGKRYVLPLRIAG